MTNLETYIQEAESQGSKHCVVDTETLRALFDVAESVKKDEARQPWFVIEALNKLDEASRGCVTDRRKQLGTAVQFVARIIGMSLSVLNIARHGKTC
jgi:hypothetical protein